MHVPFLDLLAQHRPLKPLLDAALADCLDRSAFVQGSRAAQFERAFADFLGVAHVVGCSNGTDALVLALLGLGLGPGDEVIVPANTFIATAAAVTKTGARAVFADVDPATGTMGPLQAEPHITPQTRALLPVHLYGWPADLHGLRRLAQAHGLFLVSDAAQAHGTRLGGRDVAQLSDAACYSFYPGKNLGALGDAGAVATSDQALAERIAMLANHGRQDRYLHACVGMNNRMDELQGAFLGVKLPHLRDWTEARRSRAAGYREMLSGVGDLVLPPGAQDSPGDVYEVYHLFVVETAEREELRNALAKRGVETGIHYPIPLPLQPAYASLGLDPAQFPVSVGKAGRILSLPLYPEMSAEQQEYAVQVIREFFR